MKFTMIKLYQAEWCPYSQTVWMKLTDLGIRYITVNVPREKSVREDLFRVFGQRGIPTLVHGDVMIADDDEAIITYLEGCDGQHSNGSPNWNLTTILAQASYSIKIPTSALSRQAMK